MPQTASKTTEKLLEWRNTTWTHTHIHIPVDVSLPYSGVCFTCFLSSFSFFPALLSFFSLFFFYSYTFPSLFPTSLFSLSIFITFSHSLCSLSKQQWEDRPKTGSFCSIFRLLLKVPLYPHAWAELSVHRNKKCPGDETTLTSISCRLPVLAIYLFATKEIFLCFTLCPP